MPYVNIKITREGATAAQRRDAPIDIAHVIGPTGRATHTV